MKRGSAITSAEFPERQDQANQNELVFGERGQGKENKGPTGSLVEPEGYRQQRQTKSQGIGGQELGAQPDARAQNNGHPDPSP
jgi:hypothetical protein